MSQTFLASPRHNLAHVHASQCRQYVFLTTRPPLIPKFCFPPMIFFAIASLLCANNIRTQFRNSLFPLSLSLHTIDKIRKHFSKSPSSLGPLSPCSPPGSSPVILQIILPASLSTRQRQHNQTCTNRCILSPKDFKQVLFSSRYHFHKRCSCQTMQPVETFPRQWPRAAARPADQVPGQPKFHERFSIATVDFASDWDLPAPTAPAATGPRTSRHEAVTRRGASSKRNRSCLSFLPSFFSSLSVPPKPPAIQPSHVPLMNVRRRPQTIPSPPPPPRIPLANLHKPLPPLPPETPHPHPYPPGPSPFSIPNAPAVPPCALVRSARVGRAHRVKQSPGFVFVHALHDYATYAPAGEADEYYQDHWVHSLQPPPRRAPASVSRSATRLYKH